MMALERLFSPFLHAVCGTALLALFLSGPGQPLRPMLRRRGWLLAVGAALLTLLHCFETSGTIYSYLYMAAEYCVYAGLAQALFGGNRRFNAYRVLCFYLVTDCIDTLLRYAGMRLLGADYLRGGAWFAQLLAMGVLFGITAALLLALRRFMPTPTEQDLGRMVLGASVLVTVPYLFVCEITVWLPLQNEELTAAVPLTLAAGCLVALFSSITLVGRLNAEIARRQALEQQRMLERRQQQFLLRKSSVEAVQRNYHDLKNILLYLDNSSNKTEVQDYIRKVMGEVRPYEAFACTGNEAIDILLSDKLALCQQEQIACAVDVDGTLFAFIAPLDLCVLVGNALDNAIEACLKLEDTAVRRILVKSLRRGGFVALSVRNSFDGRLATQGGLLRSTKPDAENHGYGLSNIRRTAAAYGGEVSCRRQGKEFVLTLLFPTEQQGGTTE